MELHLHTPYMRPCGTRGLHKFHMYNPCFIISLRSSPDVLIQAWINLQLRITVSALAAFLLLCGVLFTNTLYAIYPCGEVSNPRERTFGGSEVWKSPCRPVGSYKMIDLNSTCLRHSIRNFLQTLQMLLYRPTTFVNRAL